jgi:hypothetical protein
MLAESTSPCRTDAGNDPKLAGSHARGSMRTMLLAVLPLTVSLHVLSSVGVTTELIGFDERDTARAAAAVDAAIVAAGQTAVDGPALDERCVEGECVVRGVLGHSFSHLLRLSALRIGGEVETNDTLYDREGAVVATASRVVPVAAFFAHPLSPEVERALDAVPPKTTTTTTTTTTPTTSTPDPATPGATTKDVPHPRPPQDGPPVGLIVGGASAAALVGMLVGFGWEAATLESRSSTGGDKERARAGVFLYLLGAGVSALGVGTGVVLATLPAEESQPPVDPLQSSQWKLP